MPRAGQLWIQVTPSLQGFGQSVRQQLGSELPRDAKIRLDGEIKDVTEKIEQVKAKLKELEAQHADPKIDADARQLEQALEKARAKLHELGNLKPTPKLDADAARLEAKIAETRAKLDDLDRKKVDPKVDIEIAGTEKKLEQVTAKLDALRQRKVTPAVEVQIAKAEAQVQQLQQHLTDLNARRANPKVDVQIQNAQAQLQQFEARLEALNSKRVDPKVTARGIAETKADIATLEAQLARLGSMRTTPEVRAQTEEARAQLAALEAQLVALNGRKASAKVDVDTSGARAQTSALVSAIAVLGPAGVAAGAVAAAGLAAIGSGALAGLAGVLSLKAAFSGVGDAIKAFDSDQKSAATSASKTGAAAKNSADQIVSAQAQVASSERNLQQARARAADGAVQAAERIQSAQRNVASAHRAAADGIRQALRQQEQAEESLQRAQQNERRAQEDLTRARRDATRALRDMAFSMADNELAQRSAQIQFEEALRQQAQNSGTGDSLQARKDQLAVDEARQQIIELQARNKDLAADKADADRKGVNGSDQVVAAQQRVTDAVNGTRDAQRNLQDASAAVVRAQQDGAERVADAERQLASARREQAIQARDSQAAIASAQDGVASAQRSLRQALEASKESLDGAAGGAKNFAYAMSELSPAGREFVNFYIRELKPKFDELKATAQAGLLPGLQQGIRNAFPVFDQLKTIVGNSSKAIGDLATQAGTALTQPFWRDFFDFMGRTAGPTIKTLGETFGNFLKGIAGLTQALYEPVFKPLIDWFKDLSERVARFGEDAAAGKSSGFNKFMDYVRENGPRLKELLQQLGTLVGKIAEGLAAAGPGVMDALIGILKLINTLPPSTISKLIDLFIAYRAAMLVKGAVDSVKGVYDEITKIADKLAAMKAAGGLKGALGSTGQLIGGVAAGAAVVVGLGAAGDWYKTNVDDVLQRDPKTGRPVTPEQQSVGQAASSVVSGTLNQYNQNPFQAFNKPFEPGSLKWWTGKSGPELLEGANNSVFGKLSQGADKTVGKWLDDNVSNPFRNFFKSLPGKVADWWNTSVLEPTKRFFGDMPGKLAGSLGGIGKSVGDSFHKIKDDVVGKTKDTWTGVSNWWNRTKDDVTRRATDAWNGAKDRFTKLRDDITDRAKGAWQGVSGWWSRTKDDVTKRASEVWSNAKDRFTKLRDDVVDRAKDAWSGISGWWSRTKDDVTKRASEMWGNAKDRLTKLRDDAVDRTKDLWSGVSNWWARTKNDITARASEAWGNARDRLTRLRDDAIDRARAAWQGLSDWWRRTRDDVTNRASEMWGNVRDRVTRLRDDAIARTTDAWRGVTDWWNRLRDDTVHKAQELWDGVRDRFNRLRDDVINAANVLRDGVGKAFDEVRGRTAAPINWVVQTVYGDAIRGSWGKIQGFIPGLPNLPEPGPPLRFATGGPIQGPGTGTSDSIPAWIDGRGPARLSNNEHVWTSDEVDGVGGHGNVMALREMARDGRLSANQFASPAREPAGFSLAEQIFGGERFAMGGPIGLAKATAFATAQSGKPYQWTGTGPGGYDCSGLWSAIVGRILDQNPHSPRRFSTGSFGSRGAGGFVPGLGTLAIGVTPNAGDGIGHMAGSIGPLNVESRGGDGVVVGPNARGASNPLFTHQFHFPGFGDAYLGQAGSGSGSTFDFASMIRQAFKSVIDMISPGVDKFGKGPWMDATKGFGNKIVDALISFATSKAPVGGEMGATSNEAPGIVKIISDVARGRGMGRPGAIIGTATGLVESNLRNLAGGDRDSVGVFQQRPSQGWGSVAQLMNVSYAAGAFFSRFPGNWRSQPPGEVAANVQRPAAAYRGRYAQRMGQATGLVGQLGGTFDNGGYILPGVTTAVNATKQREMILPPSTTAAVERVAQHVNGGGRGRTDPVIATMNVTTPRGSTPEDMARAMTWEVRRVRRGGVYAGRL